LPEILARPGSVGNPDGSARGQKILKHLAELKLDGGGATNAGRYKRELGGLR
jgi:hypothetical protein